MKKKAEEHVNLERWMVSYADFMTLMFAVFVVLYSFAMTKQSEMQSMMQSIAESFAEETSGVTGGVLIVPAAVATRLTEEAQEAAQRADSSAEIREIMDQGGMTMDFMATQTVTQNGAEAEAENAGSAPDDDARDVSDAAQAAGQLLTTDNPVSQVEEPRSKDPDGGAQSGIGGMTAGGESDQPAAGGKTRVDSENEGEGQYGEPFESIRQAVSASLETAGLKDQVDITEDAHWLTLNINSGMLFAEGSASILSGSRPLIARIALVIAGINNFVRVRGYTDNKFVPDGIFKNSWDISAQRAVNVLNELERDGIPSPRLAVEAYGEYSPFFSNSTPAGRAQNRRVVIAISRFAMAPQPHVPVAADQPAAAGDTGDGGVAVPLGEPGGGAADLDLTHY